MRLAALLFDVTDTLIELAEDVGITYARVAARHGVQLPAPRLSEAFGRMIEHAEERVFPDLALDQIPAAEDAWWRERVRQTFEIADPRARFASFDAFFAELFAFYAGAGAWRLCAQARPALENARRSGLRVGVVSNFDHRLPGLLQDLGIQDLLETVLFPARCGFAKPSAAIFEAAVAELKLSAAQCAYVGHDPQLDLAGARAAGLQLLEMDSAADSRALSSRIEGLAKLTP